MNENLKKLVYATIVRLWELIRSTYETEADDQYWSNLITAADGMVSKETDPEMKAFATWMAVSYLEFLEAKYQYKAGKISELSQAAYVKRKRDMYEKTVNDR